MAKVEIMREYCKACGLCIEACPKHVLALGEINERGYQAVAAVSDDCIGCGNCAVMCPDAVFTVYR